MFEKIENLQANLVAIFNTRQDWSKRAGTIIKSFSPGDKFIFIDAGGYCCVSIADFATTHECRRYPISLYYLIRSADHAKFKNTTNE